MTIQPKQPSRFATLAWKPAAVISVAFVALLYVVEAINAADQQRLSYNDGVRPRSVDGLTGIVWAPLLHSGWPHLLGNTIPVLVLGFLTLLSGIGRGIAVTGLVWVVGGFGQWLTGESHSVHVGASVLVFGWLAYLLVRGLFNRNIAQVLLGVVLLVVYGTALWGILPGNNGISWQGHMFGAVGGVLAAWLFASAKERPLGLPAT